MAFLEQNHARIARRLAFDADQLPVLVDVM
jgi:hypothetical protein